MSVVFRTTRRVEFADTDMAGIVHFANFFRYMESAEHEFLRSRGLSVAMEWEGEPIGFPRVSASCDFQSPVRFEDLVAIEVELARVGSKSLTFVCTFRHGDRLIARGQLSTVCCRLRPGQALEAIEIPAGVRERLLTSAGPQSSPPGPPA
jgi:YbgC/YbaW family acyl-CoA thioester hydrolase